MNISPLEAVYRRLLQGQTPQNTEGFAEDWIALREAFEAMREALKRAEWRLLDDDGDPTERDYAAQVRAALALAEKVSR